MASGTGFTDLRWALIGIIFQRSVYKTSHTVPVQLRGALDENTFTKSRLYQLDKSDYSLVHGFYKQVEFLVSYIE